jgi:hypothetical protein
MEVGNNVPWMVPLGCVYITSVRTFGSFCRARFRKISQCMKIRVYANKPPCQGHRYERAKTSATCQRGTEISS